MSDNIINTYEIDPHVAELYDKLEQTTDDVELIRRLLPAGAELRILEPFCGSARLSVPLALDGHEVVGFDQSARMLERGRERIGRSPPEVRRRIKLLEADAVAWTWPTGFDIVILGINSFYELATAGEQERCIASAAAALRVGGHIYVDNNHMEGSLDEHWRTLRASGVFPTGTCADGTRLEGSIETTWADVPGRSVRFRRSVRITRPEGGVEVKEWEQAAHAPSAGEVQEWLGRHGFTVERFYGAHDGSPYSDASPRAIFWARLATGL